MKTIISRQNPIIKTICELHDAKGRERHGQFIAEGFRACETLIESGNKPVQLYITQKHSVDAKNIATEALCTQVTDMVMEKISLATTPSGFLGVFKIPHAAILDELGKQALIMAHISDPGNMGTLIRSCAAMGVKHAIIIEGADPYSPKVVQASAGTIGEVEIITTSWKELLENKGDRVICALVAHGGKKFQDVDVKNCLLMVGSEAHGIPEKWVAASDYQVTLSMPGNAESLNAAVAGSIASLFGICTIIIILKMQLKKFLRSSRVFCEYNKQNISREIHKSFKRWKLHEHTNG